MSAELIAIIGTGIALAGLILNGQRTQREETRDQRTETQAQFKAMQAETQAEFKTTRAAIGELRERMAHLEGLVGGLSDALLSRRVAEEPAQYGTD